MAVFSFVVMFVVFRWSFGDRAAVTAAPSPSNALESPVADAQPVHPRPVDAAISGPSADADAGATHDTAPATQPKKTGELFAEGAPSGHRIFVDTIALGETPAVLVVPCGVHTVRVGSRGTPRKVDIPCGGRLIVTP